MKCLLLNLIFIISISNLNWQNDSALKLSQKESSEIFTEEIKMKFQLDKTDLEVYRYFDKSGENLVSLSHIKGRYLLDNKDTAFIKIAINNFRNDTGILSKSWSYEKEALPDFIVGVQDIKFLNNHFEFSDLDGDSLFEPIIIYQTLSECGLLVVCKNKISSVTHQFRGYDYNTLTIDENYYKLPIQIRQHLESKLEAMEISLKSKLPDKWKKKMAKQKTIIRSKK